MGDESWREHHGLRPVVGPYLGDFLRGGADFGATTLSRFYSIHMR